MLVFFILVMFGTLTGFIAKTKNRHPGRWFLFGFVCFILAFPIICLNDKVPEGGFVVDPKNSINVGRSALIFASVVGSLILLNAYIN